MTYRQRVAVEMLKRIGFVLGCITIYLAVATGVGFSVDWVFGIGLEDALKIGFFAPILLIALSLLVFMAWDSSKDAVNAKDEKIMRALRYSGGGMDRDD